MQSMHMKHTTVHDLRHVASSENQFILGTHVLQLYKMYTRNTVIK